MVVAGYTSPMGGSKAEVDRTRQTLAHLIELSGLSRREVERRLLEEGCGTDLGRLLGGRLDLKLRHVLDICRVIEIHPLELFRIVWKEPEQRSPLLGRLEALIGPGRAQRAGRGTDGRSPSVDLEQVDQRLAELQRQVEKLTATLNATRAR
jgi:hypothetical protein